MRKNIFLCTIAFACFPFFFCRSDIKEVLQKIPTDEYQLLERLFSSLMHNDHFSYTLFGDKPVSLTSHFTLTPLNNTICKMRSEGVFWKKWLIWKKYENLFHMNRFLFFETYPLAICPQNNSKTIVFINKKLFLEKVTEHLEIFREFLGSKTTPEGLLNEIECSQNFFSNLQHNQWLIGILLGYGKHNSYLYFQRDKPLFFTRSKQFPKIPYEVPKPTKPFSSLENESKSYFSKLTPFGDYSYSPVIAKPVHFVAEKRHPETKLLEEKYRKWREKISVIYAQGNLLEISLIALTSD
jgi:hypothetical protein